MDHVKIGLSLPSALYSNQTGFVQFGDQLGHTHTGHAHVIRQPLLAGKTGVIVPGVAQEHGVGHLRAHGDVGVFEDEIRNLGKAVLQHRIDRVQLQILLLEQFPDFFDV